MARTQPIDFEEYTVSHSTASSIQLSLRTIDWHSKDSYHRFANENLSIDLTLWNLSTNVLSRASRAEIGGRRDCFGLRDYTTTSRPKRFGLEPDPLWHVTRLCPGGRCWTRQESAKFQDADRTLHSKTSKEDLTAMIEYRISLLSITTSKPGVNWTFNRELHFSLPIRVTPRMQPVKIDRIANHFYPAASQKWCPVFVWRLSLLRQFHCCESTPESQTTSIERA